MKTQPAILSTCQKLRHAHFVDMVIFHHRVIGTLLLWLVLVGPSGGNGPMDGKDGLTACYEDLVQRAKRAVSYRPEKVFNPASDTGIPAEWRQMTYDEYRDLRFRRECRLNFGPEVRYQADLFPAGFIYNRPVEIYRVMDDCTRKVEFSTELYEFGKLLQGRYWPAQGAFSGIRFFTDRYRGSRGDYADEVVVFHGASYFRAVPQGAVYGLSARGLAIDTIGSASGEEFPTFTEFQVLPKSSEEERISLLAFLESPSAVGAYEFSIATGDPLPIEVRATVFLRNRVALLGLAPLTSMFWYGENSWPRPPDFRPEVHDSDGLAIETREGGKIWRPLDVDHQRKKIRHQTFSFPDGLRGYGLFQRDRDFSHYQDLEALYHCRPDAWVELLEGFSQGTLHLIELPTGEESWDNIVAFWEPGVVPNTGEALYFSYRILWQREKSEEKLARVLSTRSTREWCPRREMFLLDWFVPESLSVVEPELVVSAEGAEVTEKSLFPNRISGTWCTRVRFLFAKTTVSANLCVQLFANKQPISERWQYLWNP